MTCVGCQQRREAVRRMAAKAGTIVFGGRKRKLGSFSEDDGEKSGSAGLDQSAADAGVIAAAAVAAGAAGTAGESTTGGGSDGGGG